MKRNKSINYQRNLTRKRQVLKNQPLVLKKPFLKKLQAHRKRQKEFKFIINPIRVQNKLKVKFNQMTKLELLDIVNADCMKVNNTIPQSSFNPKSLEAQTMILNFKTMENNMYFSKKTRKQFGQVQAKKGFILRQALLFVLFKMTLIKKFLKKKTQKRKMGFQRSQFSLQEKAMFTQTQKD